MNKITVSGAATEAAAPQIAPEFEQLRQKLETARQALEEIRDSLTSDDGMLEMNIRRQDMLENFGLESPVWPWVSLEEFVNHVLEITKP